MELTKLAKARRGEIQDKRMQCNGRRKANTNPTKVIRKEEADKMDNYKPTKMR